QLGCSGASDAGAAVPAADATEDVPAADATEDQPYDCNAEYSEWLERWDDAKKHWCCEHENKGCTSATTSSGIDEPFDCDDEYENWHREWDREKVYWCCRFKGRACTPVPADEGCKHGGKGCPPVGSTTPEEKYNCVNGLESWVTSWPVEKVHWCCDAKGICPGDDEAMASGDPYNCSAGFTKEAILHPDLKVQWCCKHRKMGCSPDEAPGPGAALDSCRVDSASWQGDWSAERKGRCCTQWDADDEWPTDMREFCCMHKDVGCQNRTEKTRAATTTAAFGSKDCSTGQRSAWPEAKKAYCCVQFREQGLVCPAGWDKTSVAPTAAPTPVPAPTPVSSEGVTTNRPKSFTTSRRRTSNSTSKSSSPSASTTSVTSTTLPYNCDAGFNNWVVGWSSDKKNTDRTAARLRAAAARRVRPRRRPTTARRGTTNGCLAGPPRRSGGVAKPRVGAAATTRTQSARPRSSSTARTATTTGGRDGPPPRRSTAATRRGAAAGRRTRRRRRRRRSSTARRTLRCG
ncbi:unnamed protein product, partial [Prorocentrum cordatum]